jgi:ADP-ribose pyrophosphatase YjhB (NUDIX family)
MSTDNKDENNEMLMTLHDKDVFPDVTGVADIVWKDRPTGKVVLFNKENKIALIGNKVNNYFLLPGGGIENDESVLEGVKRECKEETGCQIDILDALGITEDFRERESKRCISYGYSAKVISQGRPSLTENELDIGAYVKWISISEAIELFLAQEEKVRKGEVRFYNTCFNVFRDSLFIQRANQMQKDS